jgi:hypothetical protein
MHGEARRNPRGAVKLDESVLAAFRFAESVRRQIDPGRVLAPTASM